MYSKTNELTNNIEELQADILLEDTSLNSLFSYSRVASRNKSLNTDAKTIVRAINEVLSRSEAIETSVNSSLTRVAKVLGDPTDAELTCEILKRGNNLAEIVLNMDAKLEKANFDNYKTTRDYFDVPVGETQAAFRLTAKPISEDDIAFYVNGIRYVNRRPHDTYEYSPTQNVVYWVTDLFAIEDATVMIEYLYDPTPLG